MDVEEVHNALQNLMHGVEPSVVTKWVVLVETVDTAGERGLWSLTNKDAKPWDTLGLLYHAIHMEQAGTIKNGG